MFYRLGSVEVGDVVTVSRADGRTLTYTVDKVKHYLDNVVVVGHLTRIA